MKLVIKIELELNENLLSPSHVYSSIDTGREQTQVLTSKAFLVIQQIFLKHLPCARILSKCLGTNQCSTQNKIPSFEELRV